MIKNQSANFNLKCLPILIFIALLITAIFLNLGSFPTYVHDEGFFAQIAMNFIRYGAYGSNFTGNITPAECTTGPSLIAPIIFTFKMFGFGIWQARIWTALCSLAFFACLYLNLRPRFGSASAVLAITIMAFIHLRYFRMTYGEPIALLFAYVSLLVISSEKLTVDRKAFLGGLFVGLAVSAKIVTLALVPAAVISLMVYCLRSRPILLLCLFSLAFLGPQLLWLALGSTSSGVSEFVRYNIQWLIEGGKLVTATGETLSSQALNFSFYLVVAILSAAMVFWNGSANIKKWAITVFLYWLFSFLLFVFATNWAERYRVYPDAFLITLVCAAISRVALRIRQRINLNFKFWDYLAPVLGTAVLFLLIGHFYKVDENKDIRETVNFLSSNELKNHKISTYEWTLDALLPEVNFVHPALSEHLLRLRKTLKGESTPTQLFWSDNVNYVIIGPFNSFFPHPAYPISLLRKCGMMVFESGQFAVFNVENSKCFAATYAAQDF